MGCDAYAIRLYHLAVFHFREFLAMPKYVIKALIDFEAADDLDARQKASAMMKQSLSEQTGVRELILHAAQDHKSIRMTRDGSFEGQWNKSGPQKS